MLKSIRCVYVGDKEEVERADVKIEMRGEKKREKKERGRPEKKREFFEASRSRSPFLYEA